jgi:uncharacterized SAM-binding protein YcdF (DUF218 family)
MNRDDALRNWRKSFRIPKIRIHPRWFKRIFIVLLITFVVWLLVSVGLATAAHFYGQHNQAQPAEVIIVLGSGLRRDGSPGDALWRRSLWAAENWKRGLAPYIICTGGLSPGQRRSEAEACKEVLMNNGIPESMIYLESRSRSTEENAMYSKAIMAENNWSKALLITDGFHMLRASWIFNDYAISHYPAPVPGERIRRRWYTMLLTREVFALQWQALKNTLNLPITYVPVG